MAWDWLEKPTLSWEYNALTSSVDGETLVLQCRSSEQIYTSRAGKGDIIPKMPEHDNVALEQAERSGREHGIWDGGGYHREAQGHPYMKVGGRGRNQAGQVSEIRVSFEASRKGQVTVKPLILMCSWRGNNESWNHIFMPSVLTLYYWVNKPLLHCLTFDNLYMCSHLGVVWIGNWWDHNGMMNYVGT